ncbi:MAG TPA: TraR/DksA C4-type zinc finger protein [Dongiaceae bacterium]|nr:TraR/DksA C4-type zinc finger protein [Dongiaceae bacterium]
MTTKSKVTKESAPKAAKEASSTPPAKNGGAKAVKTVVAVKEPAPVEISKSAKPSAKAKPHPKSDTPQPQREDVSKPSEKPAIKVESKEKDSAEQADYLTTPVANKDQKWQEIRLILEKLKEDTIREIRKSVKIGTEAVAAIEPGGDIYDQASSERDRELGLLLGDREREKIHNIDEALLRIDEGDYGICEECDEDIPLGRLKAMPFTRHCVKCKSDLEKLQAQTKRVEEERAYREIPLGSEEEES